MKVKLLSYSPFELAIIASRTCYDSIDKQDNSDRDEQLIRNIISNGHTSVLEHLNYTFKIEGISRGCLQQLVRHRHANYSVESTRYTIKKKFKKFLLTDLYVRSDDPAINHMVEGQLNYIRNMVLTEAPPKNDDLKYALPEAFKTDLVFTANARSLRNLFNVRLATDAHSEIRSLTRNIHDKIPCRHRFMFEEWEL